MRFVCAVLAGLAAVFCALSIADANTVNAALFGVIVLTCLCGVRAAKPVNSKP
jgi:hypothetical protein